MINIDNTIWKSLILPIVAAIVTTLLVEMFAKPRLEARKNRLIRDRQQIDEVIFQFQKISLALAALVNDKMRDNHIKEKHNKIMLETASEGLYTLMNAISRLSHKYAETHKEHIRMTLLYIGYLLAKTEAKRTAKTMSIPIDDLKQEASDLKFFDIYFVANVGLRDSQEKWFRRMYWWVFERKSTINKASEIVNKYGLKENVGNNG